MLHFIDSSRITRIFDTQVVSGDQTTKMLNDVLSQADKSALPNFNDSTGEKRLVQLNNVIAKSHPLKPWVDRNQASKARHTIF